MSADSPAICDIVRGHYLRLRAAALALRGPRLQLLNFLDLEIIKPDRAMRGIFVAVPGPLLDRDDDVWGA